MSRCVRAGVRVGRRFPRVSGDEPEDASEGDLQSEFSPRERG